MKFWVGPACRQAGLAGAKVSPFQSEEVHPLEQPSQTSIPNLQRSLTELKRQRKNIANNDSWSKEMIARGLSLIDQEITGLKQVIQQAKQQA